jgi:hypothetical protein
MSIFGVLEVLKEPISAVSSLLNPEKKKERLLRRAIQAAEELFLILRKEGRYKTFSEQRLKEHEIHYQKQFNAWKNGV